MRDGEKVNFYIGQNLEAGKFGYSIVNLVDPSNERERKSWDEPFENLLQSKEEHGNTRLPHSIPSLGNRIHLRIRFPF